MRGATRWTIVAILTALGGCAHAPEFAISSNGPWPVAGTPSFGFGTLDDGTDTALRERIAACLGQKGMTAADKPAYLVQLGLSDRPAGSGVLLPGEATPAKHGAAKRQSQSLAVSITDIASGKEAYRVRVTAPYRRPTDRRAPATLADAACAAIGAPPPAATPKA